MGSAIPPGGMDPKEPKTLIQKKKYIYPKDHSSIIYKCQDIEAT